MLVRSIRARLTLWYLGLLTLSLLLLGGSAYGLLSYTLAREVDASLQSVAQALAERTHGPPAAIIPGEVEQLFRRFFGFSPWDHYFRMLDPLGRHDPQQPDLNSPPLTVGKDTIAAASRGVPAYETVAGSGPYPVRVLVYPAMKGNQVRSLIQVGMSLQNVIQSCRRFLILLATVLPTALLLAGGLGYLLAKRALLPVDRMVEAARRISARQLSQRIDESGTGDELDRLAGTLNRMLDRLDRSFSQIRRFIADASHELQTPLTIIKGEIEVALRTPRPSEEYRGVLESVLEEVDRISVLVDGLLLLARADSGVLRMDLRETALEALIREAVQRLLPLARKRGVALVPGHLEPVVIQGDPERLQRLMVNLLDNGIKYTPRGGTVTVSLSRLGSTARIEVSDTGIGIPEEDRDRIFQPFFRSENARAQVQEGNGLGLSIVRSIASAHGGFVEAVNLPAGGSLFRVVLPVAGAGSRE